VFGTLQDVIIYSLFLGAALAGRWWRQILCTCWNWTVRHQY